MTLTLDFKHLKRLVTIEQVLAHRGLGARLTRQGDRLVGPCPIHGGDNPRAFVVSLSRNLWHCFTQCGRGGDVVELVRLLDRSGYAETAHSLAALADAAPRQAELALTPKRLPFRPYVRRLPLDPTAPLLVRKRILPSTARRFETGAYYGPGFLEDCVGVRLYDLVGQPLGYTGRRLDQDQARRYGKWKLPPGLPKSELLFGLHRVDRNSAPGLVVVECPWGVMRLAQLDIPAVALLGVQMSPAQRRVLADTPRVILMLDGDPAGRTATERIRRALLTHTAVAAADLPEGLDPDDLDDDELKDRLLPLLR